MYQMRRLDARSWRRLHECDKLPVTSALNNLRGQFFTDYTLLAA